MSGLKLYGSLRDRSSQPSLFIKVSIIYNEDKVLYLSNLESDLSGADYLSLE